jgi:hypothetical protein
MKLGALLKWGILIKGEVFTMAERCGGGVAQEVVLIKVRCFMNSSRKWKKFVQKLNRSTKNTIGNDI